MGVVSRIDRLGRPSNTSAAVCCDAFCIVSLRLQAGCQVEERWGTCVLSAGRAWLRRGVLVCIHALSAVEESPAGQAAVITDPDAKCPRRGSGSGTERYVVACGFEVATSRCQLL